MSSANEKQSTKGKSKRATTNKSSKSSKGAKEGAINDAKFRGEGKSFRCKLLGVAEVDGPKGDNMCIEAIKQLKQHIKQTGEHKPRIIFNINLKGIKILEDKTKNILFEHPVNKISFITHDPEDKKIFSFISSARCSSGHVGHMMYAIKYDKVAAIITSALYELFQTVFKMRQEAQKHRKAAPRPPTPDNTSQAHTATVSNGPSQRSSMNENNIYEEPSSTSTESTLPNLDSSHYRTPIPRPLPPAPYSQSKSQGSPQAGNPETKENSKDIPANEAVSDQLFSASVFSQPDTSTSDSISVSSMDLNRKQSFSSSVSSSSDTAFYDTKSLDLKSGATSSTPPLNPRARPARSSSSAGQSIEAAMSAVPQEQEHDYESINSADYEAIPSNLAKNTASKGDIKPGFYFQESFNDDDETFVAFSGTNSTETKILKTDPFASTEKPEPKSTLSEESPPSSAVFTNDDFFSSHFDDKSKSAHAPTTDFPVDDPFAPTRNTDSKESKASEHFASSDAFATAFGSGKMSPVSFEQENNETFVGDINSNKKVNKAVAQKIDGESAFDKTFGSTESDTNNEENPHGENPSGEKPMAELSWSNAFADDNTEDNKDATPKAELSWSAAFGETAKSSEEELKTDDSTVIFPWGEESDKSQQPDKVAPEPDISWTNAFSEKPKEEVSFSWDEAFGGQKDTNDGQIENDFGGSSFDDAFGGKTETKVGKANVDFDDNSFGDAFGEQTDAKVGKANVDFGGNSFGDAFGEQTDAKDGKANVDFDGAMFTEPFGKESDAKKDRTENQFSANSFNASFASTPFQPVVATDGSTVKGLTSTPLKPDPPAYDKKDKPSVIQDDGRDPSEDETPGKVDAKQESPESKTKLTEKSSLDNEPPAKESTEVIPLILEPPERHDSLEEAVRPTNSPNDPKSPSLPPPLPPRPTAQLPSLPPRPRTLSSPATGPLPATPPRPPTSIASPASRMPKRLPPALPPRIDLELGKARANTTSVTSTSSTVSDPASGASKSTSESDNTWQAADWPTDTPKANKQDSKSSLDPFGDDFFTDFNFSQAKTDADEINSTITRKASDSFSDPFASKEGDKDAFKTDFDGLDPFADFSSNNTNLDLFSLDNKELFSGFSSNSDPFGDSGDPFADKGTLTSPFVASPLKNDKEETSLHLTKNSSDGDFADSFA